ncbi:hypothetical protein TanjilG_12061 [Lupinus angustifolius]|uniref:CRIB domain-containing protein n=1 Tax=Lupinus angustifolius TaxID=3871 RepID=A0A1J7GYB6_LUPAN|nr:hypothetical protein TanjilG_12061 [Lupinus angustifolius]
MKRSKSSSGNFVLPKTNVAASIKRLIKGIQSLSQLLFYKEEIDMEPEMKIGYPTNVKHVTHIGLDGSTITHNIKGWDNLKAHELLCLSPISLKQFQLNMVNQPHQSLINDSSSKFG